MSCRVGWRAGVGALVALACQGAPVRADVYVVRDPNGAIVLTNVPAETEASTTERVFAEQPRRAEVAVTTELDPYAWEPSLAPRPDDGRYDEVIRESAARHDVEFALVKAVIRAESAFDPFAISQKGAQGLMQLMPATARMHGVRESFRPRDNIGGGVRHLRMLMDRYGGNLPLTLAAYNAGSGRVERAGGVPDITETREYVFKVLRFRKQYLEAEGGGVLQARR
jgi:soluble lytic murein transglycosylase-like protein